MTLIVLSMVELRIAYYFCTDHIVAVSNRVSPHCSTCYYYFSYTYIEGYHRKYNFLEISFTNLIQK